MGIVNIGCLLFAAATGVPAGGRSSSSAVDPLKTVVVLTGAAELKELPDLLKCKTWEDLKPLAKKAGCAVLDEKGVAVVVEKKAFGLDALEKRKKLLDGLGALAKSGDLLVLDPKTTPADVMDALQPSLDLCSGYSLLADKSQAKPFITPRVTVTMQNGSQTVRTKWFGSASSDERQRLESPEDPQIVADWPKGAKPAQQSPLELPNQVLGVVQTHFTNEPRYVEDKLQLMETASRALQAELKRLGDALKDAHAALKAKLMAHFNSPFDSAPMTGGTLNDLSPNTRQWLELSVQENAGALGFGSGEDADTFLRGATLSLTFGFSINVLTRSPDGKPYGSSVELSLGDRLW
jgi:hypothetical protein